MSKAEELTAVKAAQAGDLKAQEEIIMANLSWVHRYARKNKNYGLGIDDLISEGTLGLYDALTGFKPEKGFRFSTWAAFFVRSKIMDFIFLNFNSTTPNKSKAMRKLFFNYRSLNKSNDHLSQSQAEEIADILNVKVSEVIEAHLTFYGSTSNSSDDGPSGSCISFNIEDTSVDEPLSFLLNHEKNKLINQAIDDLNDVNKDILLKRYINDDIVEVSTIASEYGLDQNTVYARTRRSTSKIRAALEKAG